jgi:hypothetical protein
MPFPSKGENHANGIKNERNIVNYLNSNPHNPITKHLSECCSSNIISWKHEGGTKQKMDASYTLENGTTKGVSIKNHENGTFDWVNTTKGVQQDLKSAIIDFKKQNCDKPIPKKGGIRDELNNILSNNLNKLTSNDISKLLSIIIGTEENTDYIIVNDRKRKQLIGIPVSNLDPYCNTDHNHTFILKSTPRARTSRQIWIKSSDGSEINTNLRIRLHLNNGITALLGKSTKNKSSVPCLKIQQDNVDTFISTCFDKVIVKY